MQITLPHVLVSQLSDLIAMKMGLYYPQKRWGDLERAIAAAAPELDMPDTETAARHLLSTSLTRRQIEILACRLTIGETYFFREQKCLDVLEQSIFPELIRKCKENNRQLRIWSAGCCTGEEPYSIAILLDRLFKKHGEEWNATILATDINPVFLDRAAEGLYREWAFRGTPGWIKERYFKRRKNGLFEIVPHIRKRVTFSNLNLAEDVYASQANDTCAVDVIFCRNVLMYFSSQAVKRIGQGFHRSLVDNGWLIVSPVEMSSDSFPQFRLHTVSGTGLYQKIDSHDVHGKGDYFSFGPSSDALYKVTSASAQPSSLQGWETRLSLESMEPQILPVASSPFTQLTSVQDVANQSANQEQSNTLYHEARRYADRGDLIRALKQCEEAIAANKLNPAAYYLLATIHQELGQAKEAMRCLMNTLYLEPDLVLAHFALGSLCLTQGKSREAERYFDNALSLLNGYSSSDILPDSGGLTAGDLTHFITSIRICDSLNHREIKSRASHDN
ncbi:MAG: chemotaxis protein CheR [Nitrosomonadales bacterium SCN 54-20]|nr:MAG: chemotaxis protein CheR [Nitrosomonadales bacterium SCN 54-20]